MCPNCKKRSKCGCNSCIEPNGGFDAETQTWDETGERIICPFCKISAHCDSWLNAEIKNIKQITYQQ